MSTRYVICETGGGFKRAYRIMSQAKKRFSKECSLDTRLKVI